MTKTAWNKNKAVGQKKPFTNEQIQFLQDHLTNQGKIRELALFSLQIDSMLRSSDILKLKVEDVLDFKGEIKKEINIKQKKTKHSHIVQISNKTAEVLVKFIEKEGKVEGYLFTSKRAKSETGYLSYQRHWRLFKGWCIILGVDPADYATHTGRRTRASMVYAKTKDPKMVMELLGQKDISSVTNYLGSDKEASRKSYREEYLT